MELILLEDVDKLGYRLDVVTVKNGYGRNFLIPQKKAIVANKSNLARLDEIKDKEAADQEKMLGTYKDLLTKAQAGKLMIAVKAGTSGKIFGSVTSVQIANALKDQFGIEVERRIIEIPEEVKELGDYKAILNFHKKVKGEIDFTVQTD